MLEDWLYSYMLNLIRQLPPDSLDEDLQAYVNERMYVSDTADLFLTALANSYGHTITLLIVSPESQAVLIVNLEPRRDRAMAIKRTLFLIRSGVGAATHYDAVANLADVYMAVNADMTPEISQDISPLPEQSSSSNKHTQPSPGASLLQTIPLPKAATSCKRNARRTMMTSQILTDTPVKCKIKRAAEEKRKKREKRAANGKKPKKVGVRKKKVRKQLNFKKNKKEWYCISCGGAYSLSLEDWTKCRFCGAWSHDTCGGKDALGYVCFQCPLSMG